MNKHMTCISCPMGCYLTVSLEGGEVSSVSGNQCRRGIIYAKAECKNPLRVVTTTVRIKEGELRVVPVKTVKPIPKEKIFECLKVLKEIELASPIKIGDIVVKNICNTGVDVVATRNL